VTRVPWGKIWQKSTKKNNRVVKPRRLDKVSSKDALRGGLAIDNQARKKNKKRRHTNKVRGSNRKLTRKEPGNRGRREEGGRTGHKRLKCVVAKGRRDKEKREWGRRQREEGGEGEREVRKRGGVEEGEGGKRNGRGGGDGEGERRGGGGKMGEGFEHAGQRVES